MAIRLNGKRVLILGAETEIGRAVTTAVAEVGASVAAVAASSDAEAAFAVQRLARRQGGRELSRSGGGKLVVVWPIPPIEQGHPVPLPTFGMDLRPPEVSLEEWRRRQNWTALLLHYEEPMLSRAPTDVVDAIAGEAESR